MDDEDVFEVDLITEFAFAAQKFVYDANGEAVACYDVDAVVEYLTDVECMSEDEAIEYMGEAAEGCRLLWLHTIEYLPEGTRPKGRPHLKVVH